MGTVIASDTGDDDGPRFVDVPATADTPEKVVRFLAARLVEGGQLPVDELGRVVERVLRRESLGSTAVGRGLAVSHATCDRVELSAFAVGRLPRAVLWTHGETVRMVALVVSSTTDRPASLSALDELVQRLRGRTQ